MKEAKSRHGPGRRQISAMFYWDIKRVVFESFASL